MKKKFLSLLLLIATVLCVLAGCGTESKDSSTKQLVDYAASLTLDMNSETKKAEATVLYYIDGDTTHFNVNDPALDTTVLKARYLGINTPESTGTVEAWGKTASNFTKEKLKNASSIILETDGDKWEVDSTGERHLVWIWYKPNGSDRYFNLNVQLLQEGLARGSKAGETRYGEVCTTVINQATEFGIKVFGKDNDPDFYYGDAQVVDLKTLRCNIQSYEDEKVAFDATVTQYNNNGVYLEDYDDATEMLYGIYAFYGYDLDADGKDILVVGNRVRIVGTITYYETGGTYQISSLKYYARNPDHKDSIKLLDPKPFESNPDTTVEMLESKVAVETENKETGEITSKEFDYAALALSTTVTFKNLTIKSIYTTTNEDSSSKGAMTLYCEDENGNEVQLRTVVLYHENGEMVKASYFEGKTITAVKGIIDYFSGDYQIKVFHVTHFTLAD